MDWVRRFIRRVGDNGDTRFLCDKRYPGGRCEEIVLDGAQEVGAVLAHSLDTGRQRNYVEILNDASILACGKDFYFAPSPDGRHSFYSVVVVNR